MSKKKILLVDDEQDLVDTVKLKLEFEGYEVMACYEGQDCLDKVGKIKPDIILLDVMMPRLNGYEVCRKLKEDPQTQHIPVIMLTAKVQKLDQELGAKSGANAYITKPFEFEDLLETLKKYLNCL